jgi:HEPN domain
MGEPEIAALLADGTIERVEPDVVAAERELRIARRHLETAEQISPTDPEAAFAVGYDAIRKAIAAHMRATGFRVRRGSGHHRRVGDYALAALDEWDVVLDLEAFDQLRQLRNQSQYDGLAVEPEEVAGLLVHARAIVGAIGRDLGP